ncbi:MAG TPA: hypothetical protein VIE65_20725 [Methylobacter sp.]|jgi:hypothetical protein
MQARHKRIIWGVAGLIALICTVLYAYGVGVYEGQIISARIAAKQYKELYMLNNYSTFHIDVQQSTEITKGKTDGVKCSIDLEASVAYDDLKKCQEDPVCRVLLNNKLGHVATAMFVDKEPKGFTYYRQVGYSRICDKAYESK